MNFPCYRIHTSFQSYSVTIGEFQSFQTSHHLFSIFNFQLKWSTGFASPLIELKGWTVTNVSYISSSLEIAFCFACNIHARAYDAFTNITFLVHNINVVHENQCMCIWKLP
jgi:hypothetical protein